MKHIEYILAISGLDMKQEKMTLSDDLDLQSYKVNDAIFSHNSKMLDRTSPNVYKILFVPLTE